MNTIRSKPLRLLEGTLFLSWWALLLSLVPVCAYLSLGFLRPDAHTHWAMTGHATGLDLSGLEAANALGQSAKIAFLDKPVAVTLSVLVDHHNRWIALGSILGTLLAYYGVGFLAVRVLRRLLASIRQGDPFTAENVRRIRLLGLLVIGADLASTLLQGGISVYTAKTFSTVGFKLVSVFDPHWSILLLGLGALVLAEVFGEGARIREEQALTI